MGRLAGVAGPDYPGLPGALAVESTPGADRPTTLLGMQATVTATPQAGVSLAGDMAALAQAAHLAAGAVQIVAGDPTSWTTPSLTEGVAPEAFAAAAAAAGIRVYLHSPYLINVASDNPRVRQPGRSLLQHTLRLAARIGASGVVVHGGHVTKDADPAVGIANWATTLERLDLCAPLLIENTAGGGRAMARLPEQITRLWEAVGDSGVGFCLDTCHAWAAGIPVADCVAIVGDITGRIDLVHANNSRDAFGSARDRHAGLTAGLIPVAEILSAVAAARVDAIAETPVEGHVEDLALLAAALTSSAA